MHAEPERHLAAIAVLVRLAPPLGQTDLDRLEAHCRALRRTDGQHRPHVTGLRLLRGYPAMGVTAYRVCYNVLNTLHLQKKTDYALHAPARLLSVGRLFEDKNPGDILRAVAAQPELTCTIVGDGPLRPALIELAATLGIAARTTFLAAVANDDLCRMLPDFDVFAIHSQYWECNKSLLEALLTGLPCVLNRRRGLPVPELEGDFILKVEDTAAGYRQALEGLLTDHEPKRAGPGRSAA